MGSPALVPAIALIAGVAAGVDAAIDVTSASRSLIWVLPLLTVGAAACWARRASRTFATLTILAFGVCGFVLGSHARERAIATPLRAALDHQFGGFAVGSPEGERREPVMARLQLDEDGSWQ